VYLAYASPRGRALADRRLYVPRSWTDDPDRCAQAGIPDGVEFATKPQLALDMVHGALDAGMPAGWVAADEVYGNDPAFRAGVQARGLGYVLAVSCDHRVPIDGGKVRVRADILAAGLPAGSWQRLSAGAGSKGPRFYDWAWLDISQPGQAGHSLLIRRHPTSGELAYYRCWTPRPVPLAALVRVAGTRWTVEEGFQAAKGQVGLDEHQVRQWTCWHRFTVLAMLALAFLAVCAAATAPSTPSGDPYHHARGHYGPIPLTVAEIRRLFTTLVIQPVQDTAHRLQWSLWRRRHQASARRSHYNRRLAAELGS
jgi:SRSO17 transposase